MMKAWAQLNYGMKAEDLVVMNLRKPSPGARDLLVQVKAVAINPVDYKIRENALNKEKPKEPLIVGWDAAGIVESLGSAGKYAMTMI
jgi:NADPH2:quinone reductase